MAISLYLAISRLELLDPHGLKLGAAQYSVVRRTVLRPAARAPHPTLEAAAATEGRAVSHADRCHVLRLQLDRLQG